ncbi:hypothetical protein [Pseudomonas asplenii]|uniref:hypothetical protein n=1 Tax=Pseudomonas asplenii TaxID=53407 RepID=UPI0018DEED90|nr:hypothetical protein [Pseudomonas fuscovaginae]
MVNNTLDPFVEPQDIIGGWKVISDGQKLVFGLQNNVYGQAQQSTKNAVDLATLLIPGPGEAVGVGRIGKLGQLDGKLAKELEVINNGSFSIIDWAGYPEGVLRRKCHFDCWRVQSMRL